MTDTALPAGPLLAYYGDDFTGSTDVMEAFTAAGVPTVLFLRTPGPEWVQRFAHMRCIGLAGTARGHTPAWMREHLPAAFASLQAFGAPLLHYKVCSTFDSSPERGSIGQAIDLGVPHLRGRWSPMVVGAPRLRRYQVFGHLFAAMGDAVHRLDRHPTMSRHPVTPMGESDLRMHLARQTPRRIELIDLVTLKAGQGDAALRALMGDDVPVVMLDVVDEDTLAEAGRLVWEHRGEGLFGAASSGLEYALAAHWRRSGALPEPAALPPTQAVPAIAAISGSCSPMTAAQIAWAGEHGFVTERLDVGAVLWPARREAELARVLNVALAALQAGRSPLIYSAAGPDDPAVTTFAAQAEAAGWSVAEASARVGDALAETMRRLVAASGVRRLAIAGGDSSGAVASALDIAALTVAAQLVPGAPLCRVWSDAPGMDCMEVVLKGGQMGQADFFGRVLHGTV
jgi:uncharacterized protein YgbK (DUF1537 family)